MGFRWAYVFRGNSLGIGHAGVLGESEVVGDVFVIWQPAVCPYQPIWTHSHLRRRSAVLQKTHNFSYDCYWSHGCVEFNTWPLCITEPYQYIWALDDEGASLILWYHCLDQRKAITYHLEQTQTHQHTVSFPFLSSNRMMTSQQDFLNPPLQRVGASWAAQRYSGA